MQSRLSKLLALDRLLDSDQRLRRNAIMETRIQLMIPSGHVTSQRACKGLNIIYSTYIRYTTYYISSVAVILLFNLDVEGVLAAFAGYIRIRDN